MGQQSGLSAPKLTGPAVHTQWFDDSIPAEAGYEPKIMYKKTGARVTVGSMAEQDAAWDAGFTFDAPLHPMSLEERLTALEMRVDEIAPEETPEEAAVKGDTPVLNTQTPDPNAVPTQPDPSPGAPKPIEQPYAPNVAETPVPPPSEASTPPA